MAVLPRPAARHVRGPHKAIAIVDLADDGTSLPPVTGRSRARGRAIAVAAGAVIGLAVAIAPAAIERAAAAPTPSTGVPLGRLVPGGSAALGSVLAHVLALPPGVTDAELQSMPDRYVNEPLPASFRVPLSVRGLAAVASADPPSAIIWTEGGQSYLLTSRVRSIPQLVELASRLR